MMVKPGYGLEHLHLRQPIASIVEAFGKQEKRRKVDDLRSYWFWSKLGFECLVSSKTSRVLSIFLHPNFDSPSLDELRWNENVILKHLDEPTKTGGDFDLHGGGHVNRWMTFDCGIGFELNTQGKITTISVSRPSTKTRAKAVASHHPSSNRQLAAMHR